MKVRLDLGKIRFREGDSALPPSQIQEIVAWRIAGCSRVVRSGESMQDEQSILALRSGASTGQLLAPVPVYPVEPDRIKSVGPHL